MNWQTRQRVFVLGLLLLMGLLRLMAARDPVAGVFNAAFNPAYRLLDRITFEYEPAEVRHPTLEARIGELQAENERLRATLAFVQDLRLNTIGADIIKKDVVSFSKSITVNRGSADGVRAGQAVVAREALVGIVEEVSSQRATIRLINDPQFRVTATARGSQVHGVVKTVVGSMVFDLVPDKNLRGGRVITDGLDGRFPAGLPLGEISDRLSGDDAVFQRYRLVLPVNPADIEEVLIVKGVRL